MIRTIALLLAGGAGAWIWSHDVAHVASALLWFGVISVLARALWPGARG